MSVLEELGWSAAWQAELEQHASGLLPCRVSAVDRGSCLVSFAKGDELCQKRASISGKLRNSESGSLAVGDWVGLEGERIDYVFARRSSFVRKRAGSSSAEQVIAANLDLTMVATSLNDDFSPRRVERYVLAAWDAGTTPVVLLTKCDLSTEAGDALDALAEVSAGCELIMVSAVSGEGVDQVRAAIARGKTAVLVGSSGVGKSTLINALLGVERQAIGSIREEDAKGRHTTTRRELLVIPGTGGLVIDTPGMREFGLIADEDGLGQTFADIEDLAEQCGFGDCVHQTEPNCAVLEAIDEGELAASRLASYLKLQREIAYNDRRGNAAKERQAGKAMSVMIKKHSKQGR